MSEKLNFCFRCKNVWDSAINLREKVESLWHIKEKYVNSYALSAEDGEKEEDSHELLSNDSDENEEKNSEENEPNEEYEEEDQEYAEYSEYSGDSEENEGDESEESYNIDDYFRERNVAE